MNIIQILLLVITLVTGGFVVVWAKDLDANLETGGKSDKMLKSVFTGFVTDLGDTFGIGSFAPTTAMLKGFDLIEDRMIPGTLNVSHTLPVVCQAIIFIGMVEVDTLTLVSLIASAAIGSYIGAMILTKMPTEPIKVIVGVSLFIVAILMLLGHEHLVEFTGFGSFTGDAIGLEGMELALGVIVLFILGALMSVGIGLYAPAMAFVAIMGLAPGVAFPIMFGACAALMPVAGVKFVQEGQYDRKISLGIALGGIIGVFTAVQLYSQLSEVKWLLAYVVIAVIIYTSITMLKDVFGSNTTKKA